MDGLENRELAGLADRMTVAIVITDARDPDHPITYVNEAFQRLTLYSRDYALGRNCRFLQGEKTDPADVAAIREGLASGEDFQVTITNHKADGTAFRNQLLITPVFGEDDEIEAHFGVQRILAEGDETETPALELLRELQHRVKNHLSLVVSMIRLQASRKVTPESLRAVGRRVEALALLYEELFQISLADNSGEAVRAGAYLSRIASTLSGLEARSAIRVNTYCEEIDLPVDRAARLGLLLSELLTNALEHAFEGREAGSVNVTFRKLSGGGVRLTVEDDGIGLPEGRNWPRAAPSVERQRRDAQEKEGALDTTGNAGKSGVGGSIIVALTETLGATLSVNSAVQGTTVMVDFSEE